MSPDQVTNYFTLSAEILVGFLAFQGIATTFVFGRKGHWSYLDLWLFAWIVINNIFAIAACIIPIFLLITREVNNDFWVLDFYIQFGMLLFCAILFLFTQYKIQNHKKIDRRTEEELDTVPQKVMTKTFHIMVSVPFLMPLAHYSGLLSPAIIRNWICIGPWIWSFATFANFFLLIHNALRIVDD